MDANDPLQLMLHRSDELHETLLRKVGVTIFDDSARYAAARTMCSISLEHAVGLRILVASGCHTAAVALMRLQFEALTRAMWLLYVASESAVAKLSAPLTPDNEQAANNLPSVKEMVEQIGKGVGTRVPARAHEMLVHFKECSGKSLNSFIHSGIHPLRRHAEGYPLQLILDVLRNSNALSTMAGMTLALLTGDESTARSMRGVQPEFEDCLPPLQK